jgi:membrane protease YdiL (CAAX protease family)
LVLIVLIKILEIKYLPSFAGRPVFEPLAIVSPGIVDPLTRWLIWWLTFVMYGFFICPIEELMARGGLQGCLNQFLTGKYKVITSILISNLIFGTIHLYISRELAIASIVTGVFFGWLYSRHNNIIGVAMSHAMIGIWALCVVGLFHR